MPVLSQLKNIKVRNEGETRKFLNCGEKILLTNVLLLCTYYPLAFFNVSSNYVINEDADVYQWKFFFLLIRSHDLTITGPQTPAAPWQYNVLKMGFQRVLLNGLNLSGRRMACLWTSLTDTNCA